MSLNFSYKWPHSPLNSDSGWHSNKDGILSTLPLLNKQAIAAVSWDKEVGELKIEMEDGSVLDIAEVGRIGN